MILRYNGGNSSRKNLSAGGPQGTVLGLFIFLILMNGAGFLDVEKNIGNQTTTTGKRKLLEKTHLKFVDDLTMAKAFDIKKCLVKVDQSQLIRP